MPAAATPVTERLSQMVDEKPNRPRLFIVPAKLSREAYIRRLALYMYLDDVRMQTATEQERDEAKVIWLEYDRIGCIDDRDYFFMPIPEAEPPKMKKVKKESE